VHQSADQRWRDAALCREVDPELWYPEIGEMPHDAKQICSLCPVRAECLAEALRRREPHGVWGGLTTNERHALLRAQDGRERRAA
jgi:WhiB family redox-sensing transcriptional regulator